MKHPGRQHINLTSVDVYNKLYGLPTHHPLVAVIDLKDATQLINDSVWKYGIYAIYLKNNKACRLRYGMKDYDYQEGTVVTFAPGAEVDINYSDEELSPDVVGILFHPDLIFGTPLGDRIGKYDFFHYSQTEALHLSESEKMLFMDCLAKIRTEVEHPIDSHSADLISVNIQMLLEYLYRFYDRQFITRHKANSDLVRQFERQIRQYYDSGYGKDGVPTVAYFAEKANLTPGYFGDLVKKELGITAQEVISSHVLHLAKQWLVSTDDDISQIAYALGFQYPQHFARLFKKVTGQTPTQFRKNRCV